MLDIDALITNKVADKLNKLQTIRQKADLLLKLADYEIYFPELFDDISTHWYNITGTQYVSADHYIYEGDKSLILDYAESVNSLDKVKKLINKLGSLSDGVYDYDEVITQAENEISTIRTIDDFDFTDTVSANTNNNKKPNINSLLNFKPQA
jgi:hypothetical protein